MARVRSDRTKVRQISRPVDPAPHRVRDAGAGTAIWVGAIKDRDHNPNVQGSAWYGTPAKIGVASRMMRDPIVRRSVDAVKDPILGATWAIRPASKEPLDVEIADYCYHNLFELTPWERTLSDALHYIRDGISMLEMTSDVRPVSRERFPNHPNPEGAFVLTAFHYIPTWTIDQFVASERDSTQLDHLVQYVPGSDVESTGYRDVDAQNVIRFTWEQEGANFTGFAPLRSAYGSWDAKILLMTIDMIRHEREGAGVPSVKLPVGADQDVYNRAKDMLQNLRVNDRGYLIWEDGTEFEFAATRGVSTGLGEAIDRCNRDICFNLGVAQLLLGTAGKTGSWALSESHDQHYYVAEDKHARFAERVINVGADGWSVIERLVRRNYGPNVALPRVCARHMPTRPWQSALAQLPALVSARIITPDDALEDHARDVMTLSPRDPNTAREYPGAVKEEKEVE